MSHPDIDQTELQKLLRCKRYEQPPPGFFLSFSDKVIARLEAEESVQSSSWWNWLLDRFDAKPVLACAYGLAVSSLLFTGFRLSQVFEADLAPSPFLAGPRFAATPASILLFPDTFSQDSVAAAGPTSSLASSRLVFRDEPNHNLLPASGFRVQSVGFGLSGR